MNPAIQENSQALAHATHGQERQIRSGEIMNIYKVSYRSISDAHLQYHLPAVADRGRGRNKGSHR